MQRYEGTVLFVTYDQDLIDEVATRIWYLSRCRIEDFHTDFQIRPTKQVTYDSRQPAYCRFKAASSSRIGRAMACNSPKR